MQTGGFFHLLITCAPSQPIGFLLSCSWANNYSGRSSLHASHARQFSGSCPHSGFPLQLFHQHKGQFFAACIFWVGAERRCPAGVLGCNAKKSLDPSKRSYVGNWINYKEDLFFFPPRRFGSVLERGFGNCSCWNLLYCCLTPGFIGGSDSWRGSQTADSFSLKFERGWNQLLPKPTVNYPEPVISLFTRLIQHFSAHQCKPWICIEFRL